MQPSIVAIRVSRPDHVISVCPSLPAADSITLTVTMSPDYPQVAPAICACSESLHRRDAEQLSAALAEQAKLMTGQPMILDEFFKILYMLLKHKYKI